MSRVEIADELQRVGADFRALVADASAAQLRRRSAGTRWTNRQLLFHMLFGYLIVRTLMPLVHLLGRLGWSRRFAAVLNAARGPFHVINYLGSVGGGQLLRPAAMVALMDRTVRALQRRLARETDDSLSLRMHFPVGWDPYFRSTMSVEEVYHYGTEHYEHHRRQLTV
ncbi:MAG TPA: DinB family protein [Microlunatus sp.]|nr:DinB family protein [Microlunatus sp.]